MYHMKDIKISVSLQCPGTDIQNVVVLGKNAKVSEVRNAIQAIFNDLIKDLGL